MFKQLLLKKLCLENNFLSVVNCENVIQWCQRIRPHNAVKMGMRILVQGNIHPDHGIDQCINIQCLTKAGQNAKLAIETPLKAHIGMPSCILTSK